MSKRTADDLENLDPILTGMERELDQLRALNADLLAALAASEHLLEALRTGYLDIATDTRIFKRCRANLAIIARAKGETK